MPLDDPRTALLAERLTAVRGRIAAAVAASAASAAPSGEASAGESAAADPALIVVTKFHPAADVLRLRSLGVADVGENRDQEAAAKAAEVADAALRWHFVGQLQSNKAKSVVRYAHSVHSIDRSSLIKALAAAMAGEQQETGRTNLDCFLQLDLSGAYPGLAGQASHAPSGRGGLAPSDMAALADRVASSAGLTLAGVMAVAPLGVAPEPIPMQPVFQQALVTTWRRQLPAGRHTCVSVPIYSAPARRCCSVLSVGDNGISRTTYHLRDLCFA